MFPPANRLGNALRGKAARLRRAVLSSKAMRALASAALVFAYLLAATQLAFPCKAWLESASSRPAVAEAFACAVHKCQCRNALECRAHCCCFPKAAAAHSHGHEDGLDSHWAACAADENGLMPPLPLHAPAAIAGALTASTGDAWHPASLPAPPAPDSEPPLKVPILLPS